MYKFGTSARVNVYTIIIKHVFLYKKKVFFKAGKQPGCSRVFPKEELAGLTKVPRSFIGQRIRTSSAPITDCPAQPGEVRPASARSMTANRTLSSRATRGRSGHPQRNAARPIRYGRRTHTAGHAAHSVRCCPYLTKMAPVPIRSYFQIKGRFFQPNSARKVYVFGPLGFKPQL